MKTETVIVQIKARWWVPLYVHTLAFVCVSMGTEPDLDKVATFLGKYGFKIKVVR